MVRRAREIILSKKKKADLNKANQCPNNKVHSNIYMLCVC